MAFKRVLARAPFPQTAFKVEGMAPVAAAPKPKGKRSAAAAAAATTDSTGVDGAPTTANVWFNMAIKEPSVSGASVGPRQSKQGHTLHGYKAKAGEVYFESKEGSFYVGTGSDTTVGDYRLAVHCAVNKAKQMDVKHLTLNIPDDSVVHQTDLFSPVGTAIDASTVVEKTACFATTAMYSYDRMKAKSASAQAEEETATKSRKKPVKEAPRSKSAAAKKRGAKKGKGKQEEAPEVPEVSAKATPSSSSSVMSITIASENTEAIRTGATIGECVNTARNLGNLREDEGIPEFYAEWAVSELTKLGVKFQHVLKGPQLQKEGLNLLYSVGKGSIHTPYLVVCEYQGNKKSNRSTALVGKGVTFDCGGMNVKPYGSMETMHMDMMGAATVLSTMKAIATLQLPINVVATVGLVENAIGPNAYFPSTIIRSLKGTNVEVLNTDAEGRLVLADALTFVQKHAKLATAPDTFIDLATLTGAILIGLGSKRTGLFSNDYALTQSLMQSGRLSAEELWPMPIAPEHKKAIKGGIADLRNVSTGREGGSCTAAAFLNHFIENGNRWAHLDIAGTGMNGDKANGYNPAGAPGYGVQLLVDYLRQQ